MYKCSRCDKQYKEQPKAIACEVSHLPSGKRSKGGWKSQYRTARVMDKRGEE